MCTIDRPADRNPAANYAITVSFSAVQGQCEPIDEVRLYVDQNQRRTLVCPVLPLVGEELPVEGDDDSITLWILLFREVH